MAFQSRETTVFQRGDLRVEFSGVVEAQWVDIDAAPRIHDALYRSRFQFIAALEIQPSDKFASADQLATLCVLVDAADSANHLLLTTDYEVLDWVAFDQVTKLKMSLLKIRLERILSARSPGGSGPLLIFHFLALPSTVAPGRQREQVETFLSREREYLGGRYERNESQMVRPPFTTGVRSRPVPRTPPATTAAVSTEVDAAAASPAATPRPDSRWLNAEIEGFAPDETLPFNKPLILAVSVDALRSANAVAADGLAASFPEGEEEIELTVVLNSDDFDVSVESSIIRVPRIGSSTNNARFALMARHEGECVALAFVFVKCNYVQQLKIAVVVGVGKSMPRKSESTGRRLEAANSLRSRDISLHISPAPSGGYMCLATGSTHAQAVIGLTQAFLAAEIQVARNAIMRVINLRDANNKQPFQTMVKIIDNALRDDAVRILAEAGHLLFRQIFFGPSADEQTKMIGKWLLKQASDATTTLNIQIVSRDFPVPWAMLYLTEKWDPRTIDWNRFLGMRHVVEQIPAQTNLSTISEVIGYGDAPLLVGLCFNDAIDVQMSANHVGRQAQYWADVGTRLSRSLVCKRRKGKAAFIAALQDPNTSDHITYLYCHAETSGLNTLGGPGSSWLSLEGDERVLLNELRLNAPDDMKLRGEPLIFINACESAEMSPAFYDGFVPYFMSKGARGVIGTECKTPALFAVEWSISFFDGLLAGKPIGQLVLDLRRQYYEEQNNPLGLMYAIHCDGDTVVTRTTE